MVKEIGSGVNDTRPKGLKLLTDLTLTRIGVEHQDRLTHFGLNDLEPLLKRHGRAIERVNLAQSDKETVVQGFVSMVTAGWAWRYGQPCRPRNTERRIAQLPGQA